MCAICVEAKKKPVHLALKLIATAMQNPKNAGLECLDETIGLLISQPAPVVDRAKERDWARGTVWDKTRQ